MRGRADTTIECGNIIIAHTNLPHTFAIYGGWRKTINKVGKERRKKKLKIMINF